MSKESPVLDARRARATTTIFAGAALGTSAFYAVFTLSPLAARELTGADTWTGIPSAAGVLGAALGSALLSRLMARRGRRAGLRLGFALGVVGGAIASLAAAIGSFALLLAGVALVGTCHAANQLSRFSAADMYPPERRASALGTVVWAGTVGAILGPNLLKVAEPAGRALGLARLPAGFALGCAFAAAALGTSLVLRPDPSALAHDDGDAAGDSPVDIRALWHMAHVRVALVSMVLGQVAMVFLMTVTPVHVRHAGHGMGAVGIVMGSHFVGMFALAPLIGRLTARVGSGPVIVGGMVILLGGATGAPLVPASSSTLLAVALFLLGLGWSCGFVAGSALLTRGLSYAQRVRLQGSVDAVVWSASAAASLSSGLCLALFGFTGVGLIGAAIALGPVLYLTARRGAAAPA